MFCTIREIKPAPGNYWLALAQRDEETRREREEWQAGWTWAEIARTAARYEAEQAAAANAANAGGR